jgi:hypothetical protein
MPGLACELLQRSIMFSNAPLQSGLRCRFSLKGILVTLFAATALLAYVHPVGAQTDDDAPVTPATKTPPTDMFDAAAEGDIKTLGRLLDRGLKVNQRGTLGVTPLIMAAGMGETEAVRFLLARGADPSLRDEEGKTAAMRAREYGFKALATFLERAVTKKPGTAAKQTRPTPVAVTNRTEGTGHALPPPTGKAPSDAFLRELVQRYYRMKVNGTLTAPLRIDVNIVSFVREPVVQNTVSVRGGRVYRVNDATA